MPVATEWCEDVVQNNTQNNKYKEMKLPTYRGYNQSMSLKRVQPYVAIDDTIVAWDSSRSRTHP